ncbi:SDR family NAD(P)-dependent oxidoreductase [Verrucomicrobiota bacterium]
MPVSGAGRFGITIRMTCSNPDTGGGPDCRLPIVCSDSSTGALDAAGDAEALRRRAAAARVDAVLWIGASTESGELIDQVAALARRRGDAPAVIGVEGAGLFGVGNTGPAALRAVRGALPGADIAPGTSPDTGSRLAGHAVIVTGAAQGLGRGLAEELAEEGACIAIADVSEEQGRAAAVGLNSRFGEGTALFCPTDVTSLESLESCVSGTTEAFGGVDILIANAGVLRAGGIEEMDGAAFDLVTGVNYKAYFLCVKAVTPVMKLQHKLHPGHFMDIIQISSKSGLVGSNRNFAYAGSKFGAIGLTQSFALELLEHNVKVNSVCPGNYFDGPLWSDPRKGLLVQYLEAGKVPGATSVDEVRRHYMAKTPMGRGCVPADVAKAVLYLHDQEYETGQALPVTGGQVMLK